ncbi:hypothetical protein EAH_00008420 [Eimeria acervulina]|uniref:Uncharacterized protein n=1 Tax=Eimeria acervulina TaxID=5801 RepID=U6GF06_EIMAC|nr:hypothetical protein EAH_00008420 [Eimeria acervulina]CDI78750.1 hypothetical protein EAH_00008420 [Eimeria acervulina]
MERTLSRVELITVFVHTRKGPWLRSQVDLPRSISCGKIRFNSSMAASSSASTRQDLRPLCLGIRETGRAAGRVLRISNFKPLTLLQLTFIVWSDRGPSLPVISSSGITSNWNKNPNQRSTRRQLQQHQRAADTPATVAAPACCCSCRRVGAAESGCDGSGNGSSSNSKINDSAFSRRRAKKAIAAAGLPTVQIPGMNCLHSKTAVVLHPHIAPVEYQQQQFVLAANRKMEKQKDKQQQLGHQQSSSSNKGYSNK